MAQLAAGKAGEPTSYCPTRNAGGSETPSPELAFGLPAAKTMYGPDEPALQGLRRRLESDWIPGLESIAGVHAAELPALWDADFLFGPRTDAGEDTYVLCEINAGSVIPFPDDVPRKLGEAVSAALDFHARGG